MTIRPTRSISISVLFDDPARFPARMHVHYGERIAWFDTIDHTPRYRTSSAAGEPPMAMGPVDAPAG